MLSRSLGNLLCEVCHDDFLPGAAAKGLSLMLRGVPFAAMLPAICLIPLTQNISGFLVFYDSLEVAALLAGVGTFAMMRAVPVQPGRGLLIASTALFGLTFVRGLLRWLHFGFLLPLHFSPFLPYLLGFAMWLVFLRPVMEELGLVAAIGFWRSRWLFRYYAVVVALVFVALWSGSRNDLLVSDGEMNPAALIGPAAAAIAQLILLIAGIRVGRALRASPAPTEAAASADDPWMPKLIAGTKIAAGGIWLAVIGAAVFDRWPHYPRNAEDRMFGAVAVALSATFALASLIGGLSDLLGSRLRWPRRLAINGGLTLACVAVAFEVFVAGNLRDKDAPPTDDFGGLSFHRAPPDLDAPLQQFYRAYQVADLQSPHPIWDLADVGKYAAAEMSASEVENLAKDYDFRLGLRIKGIVPENYRYSIFAYSKARSEKLRVLYYSGQIEMITRDQFDNGQTSGPEVWPLVRMYKAYFEFEEGNNEPAKDLEFVATRAGFKQDEVLQLRDDFTWNLGQSIRKTPREQLEQRIMAYHKRIDSPTGQGFALFYDGTIKEFSHDALATFRTEHPEPPAADAGAGK